MEWNKLFQKIHKFERNKNDSIHYNNNQKQFFLFHRNELFLPLLPQSKRKRNIVEYNNNLRYKKRLLHNVINDQNHV